MRWAIPASVGIHLGLIAAAWLVVQWKPEDLSTAEAVVAIDIVSMEDAVAEPSDTVSEAMAHLVSAGITQAAAEPLETEAVEPVAPSDSSILERLDQAAKLTELEPAPEVQEITTASINPIDPAKPVEIPEPVKIANLNPMPEAIVEEVVETPPMPAPRILRKPIEAEQKPVEDKKPVEKKKAEKPVEKKKTKQVASLGNGGEAEADSSAAKASGGKQGKVSSDGGNNAAYAGKVRAKVIKALKRPSGSYDPGEARVSFTIDAGGRLTSVRLAGSSGDAKVDKAVLAAVERAAPYPGFGEGAPRSFTFPLMIQ